MLSLDFGAVVCGGEPDWAEKNRKGGGGRSEETFHITVTSTGWTRYIHKAAFVLLREVNSDDRSSSSG